MTTQNLFSDIPEIMSEELIEVIASGNGDFRIERIISRSHQSPSHFWYDQDTTEWVLLLQGAAELQFEEQGNQSNWLREIGWKYQQTVVIA